MKYRKCNKCGWVHFVISLAQAVFTQNPFKCWKCGNDHENFTATVHAPLGATLQPIFEPRTLASTATKEPEDDSDLLELALDVGSAVLDIASAVSDSSDSSGGSSSDSWGGGGGEFGGGGASSDF